MSFLFGMGDEEEDDEGGLSIAQLTIDDDLPPLERLLKYTKSEIALQRLVHVKAMADTVRQVGFEESFETLSTVMHHVVNDEETDVKLTLAEQIAELAALFLETGGERGYEETHNTLLNHVATLLTDTQATVRTAAGNTLVNIAPRLRKEHLESPVLSMVLYLSHGESEDHRALAAQLLNDMAEAFGPDLCTNFGVPELRSLAEDQEFGVRKAAARNMGGICRAVGQELSQDKMLPVFVQLSKDDIWGVRKSCAEALSDMSACMPSACRSEELVAMFNRLSTDMSRWVRFSAFQTLGPLIATLDPEEITPAILDQFTNMATGEGEITLYCAFNFPGVLLTVGASRWEGLREAYMTLVKDVHQWKVRRSLAHSLHEIAKILGPELTESALCTQVFDVFLKDLHEVRVGVMKNYSSFLAVLSPERRKSYLHVLSDNYLDDENVGKEWRIREILATQIAPLCDTLDSEEIREVLVTTFFKFAVDPVASVRIAAHGAICPLLLRAVRDDDAGQLSALVEEVQALGEADTYIQRQVFAQMCECLAKSDCPVTLALTEKHFLSRCIALHADRVTNVKLAVVRLCSLILSTDVGDKLKWDQGCVREDVVKAIGVLRHDRDREVQHHCELAIPTAAGPEIPAAAPACVVAEPEAEAAEPEGEAPTEAAAAEGEGEGEGEATSPKKELAVEIAAPPMVVMKRPDTPAVVSAGAPKSSAEALCDEIFDVIDTDNSGQLEEDEVLKIFEHFGASEHSAEDQWKKMLQEMDMNDDGKISKIEFRSMWMSKKEVIKEDGSFTAEHEAFLRGKLSGLHAAVHGAEGGGAATARTASGNRPRAPTPWITPTVAAEAAVEAEPAEEAAATEEATVQEAAAPAEEPTEEPAAEATAAEPAD